MKPFPAISSILSPEPLSDFLKEKYDLSEETSCQIFRQGINHTYQVLDGENKYILRIYHHNWRTKKEIEEELRFLNLLKGNGISVSYPIPDKKAGYIQTIEALEGSRFAVLFSYAEGKAIRNPSEQACFQLGVEMAKMHQVAADQTIQRKNYDAETLTGWAFNTLQTKFPMDLEEMQYIDRAHQAIAHQFQHANPNELRRGIVHLDLWYDNMRIKDDSQITFFDFDNCGNGWLFLDIAYSLMLLFKHEPDKAIFQQKKEQLYKGYESIHSISHEEKRLLPYGGLAIWLHYSGIHVIRFDDFTNVFLSEDFLKFWIHTVNLWMEFNGIEI